MSIGILLALLVPVQPQVSVSGGIQVEAHVPTIQFEAAPALMVVAPGIMVVPNHDREVFFADGFYWYNMSGAWFRTRSHRGGWVRVAYAQVPQPIIRLPRGKYRHFRGGKLYRRAARPPVKVRPRVVSRKARVAHTKKTTAKKRKAHAAKKKTTAHAGKKSKAYAVKNKKGKASTRKTRSARAGKSRKVRSARAAPARRRSRH